MTNSGFAAPPTLAPHAQLIFGLSHREYLFPAAFIKNLTCTDARVLRRDWEGISEGQEQLKDTLGTEQPSSSSAQEFWVPLELEAAGSPCTGAKDNCSSTHRAAAPGKPLLPSAWHSWGSSCSGIAGPSLEHPGGARDPEPSQGSRGHHVMRLEHTKAVEMVSVSLGQGRLRNNCHFPLPEVGYREAEAKPFFIGPWGKRQDKGCSKGNFDWLYRKKCSEVNQLSTEASCSGDWNLHPQRFSKHDWTQSRVTWLNLQESPALSRKIKARITSTNLFQPKCF